MGIPNYDKAQKMAENILIEYDIDNLVFLSEKSPLTSERALFAFLMTSGF